MTKGLQTLVPGSECPLVANHGELAIAWDRAQRRVLEPRAASTQRAYRVAWRQWREHCTSLHVPMLPIQPSHLVAYLEQRTAELAPNTIRVHLAALAALDREARLAGGEDNPASVAHNVIVTRWLESWSRDNPRAPRRKAPSLSRSELEAVISRAQERDPHGSRPAHIARYLRDRAILLFGVVGCFRGAELAGLLAGDVLTKPRGLQVLLRRSKTDQHGESLLKGLAVQSSRLLCPVAAWEDWARVRGEWEGAAFVPVGRDGSLARDHMTVDAIRRMVRRRATAAGVAVTSHSMRATFVTLARERGKPLDSLARQGGWRSLESVRGYTRQTDIWDANASDGVLDE